MLGQEYIKPKRRYLSKLCFCPKFLHSLTFLTCLDMFCIGVSVTKLSWESWEDNGSAIISTKFPCEDTKRILLIYCHAEVQTSQNLATLTQMHDVSRHVQKSSKSAKL